MSAPAVFLFLFFCPNRPDGAPPRPRVDTLGTPCKAELIWAHLGRGRDGEGP